MIFLEARSVKCLGIASNNKVSEPGSERLVHSARYKQAGSTWDASPKPADSIGSESPPATPCSYPKFLNRKMLFGQQLKAIPSSRCLLIAYAESEFGVFTPFYIPTKVRSRWRLLSWLESNAISPKEQSRRSGFWIC